MIDQKVLVLGAHASRGPSMVRYSRLLLHAYRTLGVDVRLALPEEPGKTRRAPGRLDKLLAYLQVLLIFPVRVRKDVRSVTTVHIADHSDAPWLLIVPKRVQKVLTCHDVLAIRSARGDIPDHRTRWTGRLYQRLILFSIRRADLVIAVSEPTAADLAQLAPSLQIKVLPNCVDPGLLANRDLAPLADRGHYALMVGGHGWRKQRHLALASWLRLRATSAGGLRLVSVGPPFSEEEIGQAQAITGQRIPANGIDVVSGISDDQLSKLYMRAQLLLQLTRYEGFGWPIAEANLLGTVALCTASPLFLGLNPSNCFVSDDEEQDWELAWQECTSLRRRRAVTAVASKFAPEEFYAGLAALVLARE